MPDDYSELQFQYRLAQVNIFLQAIAIFINIFHLSILIRKELRSLSVFILMISICSCDIIYLSTNLITNSNFIRTYLRTNHCYTYDNIVIMWIMRFFTASLHSSELASVWLVVIMAIYRSLSVTFPLNQFIKKLTAPKNTLIVLLSVMTLCFSYLHYQYFLIYSIQKRGYGNACHFITDINATEADQYRVVYYTSNMPLLDFLSDIRAWMQRFQLIAYLICVVILILSLKKSRKPLSVSNQKTDNTTKLVLAMTIVFFGTQIFHPILDFVYSFLPDDTALSQTMIYVYTAIKSFLQTIHTASHCPLSFFMSTAYKDTVKRVFGVRKKMKVVSVTGSVNSKSLGSS